MTDDTTLVTRADASDLDGILALQAENQIARGGTLAASLLPERVVAMMAAMPLIVARRGDRVVGFLMTTDRATNADLAIVRAMFAAYPGVPDAYVYGPICVDADARGQGLAQRMFDALRALEPGREGVLFIRRDNTPSLRAHLKMGMREVARFPFNGFEYAVFAYVG
ncbi:MAG: GNAT family N-acetyltransferase [Luteimonas sp.]